MAAVPALIAMNVLARDDRNRPQDLDDLRALLKQASHSDVKEASDLVRLIEQRGFARGKALLAEFEQLLE